MLSDLRSIPLRLPLLLLLGLIVAATITGGSNRGVVPGVLVVRLTALVCLAAAIARMPSHRIVAVRVPLAMLLVLSAWIAVQLIPLPHSLWSALPGRVRLGTVSDVMGTTQPWLPISIAPMRTFNSLLAVLVPLAGVLMVGWLPRRTIGFQTGVLIAVGIASGALALLQIMGPPDSQLYLYAVIKKGGAVGVFANRNHQAILLASLFPMLIALGSHMLALGRRPPMVLLLSGALTIVLIVLIFITGSRAGLVLMLISIGASLALILPAINRHLPNRRAPVVTALLVAVIGGSMAAAALSNRSLSLQRLSGTRLSEEQRIVVVDPILRVIRENMPVGSGFGTFDRAFRSVEPDFLLHRTYLNHAHSEPLEVLSDGGLPAAVLLLMFLVWWTRSAIAIWFQNQRDVFAQGASIATATMMLSSLLDYPLRTPLCALVFAMLISWMALGRAGDRSADRGPLPPPA